MMPLALLTLSGRLLASPHAAGCVAWLARLLTRIIARQLQLPEALVHATGLYIYSRVDAFERSMLKSLIQPWDR
jgi:hypothetical protein